ncbi:sensor domain-containing diguanylate cyclase [Pseudazoarcus pumilus]|uniref:Diguanylate cyclase n=1 Tax=Pseudazoarcus pumilus TaxID=2067960 RepID=A0A2I6S4W1_9RHOO|nr:diguanylate cyclase [Pseudazoarcus pumilus]AUN94277.1 hypothetical protein C0099_04565 [Pseudazoarcus pumilus]
MDEQRRAQNWLSGRSLRWRMGALAGLFALIFGLIAFAEVARERAVFERETREATQALRIGLTTTLETTEREMLNIASLLAVDPEVRYYLRRAHELVASEGGGAGGERAAALREAFAARLAARGENHWSDELSARQVEFHLQPDGANFLRTRDPRLFGDALDEVRPLVAATHALGIPISGFEVGRMYAGLRGLHPVMAVDDAGDYWSVGSVEIGIAMRDLLADATSRFDAEYALALAPQLIDGVMWVDDIRATLIWSESCRCYIDNAYRLGGPALLDALPRSLGVPIDDYRMARIGERRFAITRVSLTDQLERIGAQAVAGHPASIYIFSDRSGQFADYRAGRARVLGALGAAYLAVLLLGWLVLRRIVATEAALETAQRYRSALFMLSPDAVLVVDRDGTITEVNPRFCEITGYAPAEVVGKNARMLQSGNTPPEVYREIWDTLLAGREWRGDLQNRRKDGSLYWEAHAIVPVREASGEIARFVSFQRDISERHEMERALSASERLYRSIHDNVQEAIFLVRVAGEDFVYVGNNPRHEQTTGLSAERLRGARPQDILSPDMARAAIDNYRRCVAERRTIRYEEELALPAGTRYWMTSLAPVFDDEGCVEMIVGLSVDVTESKRAEADLRRLATTDVLTGLANRRHFLERATQELVRVRRYVGPAAFVMLDIDHFKRINDTWGHAAGDAVLRLLAGVLVENLRETDLVGRLGGEEFGVLLPQTDLEAAQALTERLREAITEVSLELEGEVVRFSSSFGLTLLHADDEDFDAPMARADAALYAAKFAGSNRVKWRIR